MLGDRRKVESASPTATINVRQGSPAAIVHDVLINTDGLAFFGPGSEWFWSMLQFAVVAITLYAIYRQLRAQQVQIRDSNKLLRSQAHYNALSLAQDHWHLLIDNADLARIVTVGYATPEALSEVEWTRCTNYMFVQFNAWEYLYYQHGDGSIPKELWVGADAFHKSLVATKPGFVRFWSEFEDSFDEPVPVVRGRRVRPAAGAGQSRGPSDKSRRLTMNR